MKENEIKTNITLETLREKCVITDSGCWVWKGRIEKHGYPWLCVDRQKVWVHRLVWQLDKGEILSRNIRIGRTCRTLACINPDHLYIGKVGYSLKKDLTGMRFGRLIVTGRSDYKLGQKVYWDCICDCGNKCTKTTRSLERSMPQFEVKSCGCWKDRKDYTGQRFGHLTVISPTDIRSGGRYLHKCLCDCGNIHFISSNGLRQSPDVSCGCGRDYRKKFGERLGGAKRALATYRNGAKRRGLEFRLDLETFADLIYGDCFYCGKPADENDYRNVRRNGVDRIDNRQGYTLSNCVSCCTDCNIKKGTMSSTEFIAFCDRVTNYQNSKMLKES